MLHKMHQAMVSKLGEGNMFEGEPGLLVTFVEPF